MRVTAENDRPVIDGQIVEHFMDDVRQRRVFAFWIARCDQAEVVHELHQARNILLRFLVPNRSCVATGLIGTVDDG